MSSLPVIRSELPDFSSVHVLAVGDLMLDQYWHGQSRRISPEAPVPVVHVRTEELRPGGAGNVALNLASLGAKVTLLGLTGADDNAAKLQTLLQDRGVDCRFQAVPGHDTALKLRVIAQHQQMIRLDFEDSFSGVDKAPLQERFTAMLPQADIVLLSDYNKGTLSAVADLIRLARDQGKAVVVDPKGNDFTRYHGASLITPNRSEFEAIAGPCADEPHLEQQGQRLREQLALQALLITRGDEGMTLLEQGHPALHLPTHAREVFDVTGAGDTVIATLTAMLGAGSTLPQAVYLANVAAGIVVRKLGTATASPAEIRLALQDPVAGSRGVVEEARLTGLIQAARQQGERIIMTNGCFDLLHPGHIHYLEQARALGDRLVVAVNTDASVRRLKGAERPLNPLAARMAMLAALHCVDWVVAFAEDTPERLYCQLLPDVIVKGGDYHPHQVAGGDCVRANGGTVEILDFLPGHSTTALIGKIRHGQD
ncbi:MAG TPA: bifunctional D-glycero-beta-D-manno-heptose-7-phosphate kinase/D-glycero-beta-D-manno-heptose 1-phosphate adenylyltransferase HldE [Thiolinea sp.]|nr:bifunctional D-glycero-beta-D-manno-heptose-7-phosphate kinase/D-glycero-beta-D-manno-heptose 1-phosphate adenylyltransferase HldE [Thiolinea sp.]